MMHRGSVVFVLIAALVLAGCRLDTTPQDVGHFSSNRAAVKDTADYTGTFILYHDDMDQKVGAIVTSVHLTKGQAFGFEFDAHQQPLAIAGTQNIPLTSGRYRWEMTPDEGQIDWDKTNGVIVTVVVFTVIVAVSTISILFATKQL